jgi:ketosteroid isomerase-like protein
MHPSRRCLLAAAGAGVASIPLGAAAACIAPPATIGADVDALVRLSEESNAALMRGDGDRYLAMVNMTDDFTLMAPFGGAPSRGAGFTPQKREALGRFFRNGTFQLELVQAYGSDDMVVLALIERCNVEVGGLPAQEWLLRVTLVYRREAAGEAAGWRLAHRHADPLAKGISLRQAAALARGETA